MSVWLIEFQVGDTWMPCWFRGCREEKDEYILSELKRLNEEFPWQPYRIAEYERTQPATEPAGKEGK